MLQNFFNCPLHTDRAIMTDTALASWQHYLLTQNISAPDYFQIIRVGFYGVMKSMEFVSGLEVEAFAQD